MKSLISQARMQNLQQSEAMVGMNNEFDKNKLTVGVYG